MRDTEIDTAQEAWTSQGRDGVGGIQPDTQNRYFFALALNDYFT